LQVSCLGLGVLLVWLPVTELQPLRAEPGRWARATRVETLAAPTIELERKLLFTSVLADVYVRWQDSTPAHARASLKYDVLWYARVEPPYLIKRDALGTLSNVGLALRRQRQGCLLLFFVAGLGCFFGCAYYAYQVVRRQRDFRAVSMSPRVLYRPLQKTEVLRQKGIATGQVAYTFLAPSGEAVQQILTRPREPVFDLDDTSVLVVTAFDAPDAEPILVADDGYPFASRSR
jgi:hypothetical protein